MPGLDRKIIFDCVRKLRDGKPYTQAEVVLLDAAIDAALATIPVAPPKPSLPLAPAKPAITAAPNGFVLGTQSRKELEPVHPKLRMCVERAIQYSMVDFRVNQGERTIEEQKKAVASGNSRTMKSKHLRQSDGLVWAVDLVALVGGKVTWNFDYYYYLAMAMDRAATELGVANHIRWGCSWDRVLADFGGDKQAYIDEVQAYKVRHKGSDLLDAPHFEWVA